jgi:hypothetical protein
VFDYVTDSLNAIFRLFSQIMDQSPSPTPPSPLHLVGYFDNPYAGAELELVALAGLLLPYRPVQAIQPFAGQFPREGELCWGGAHVPPAVWLKYARFGRVIVHCNLASYERLFALIEILRDTTLLEPELVFASQALRLTAGLPGRVVYSLMDIGPFLQVGRARTVSGAGRLTVGRVSRDAPDKHHPQDPALGPAWRGSFRVWRALNCCPVARSLWRISCGRWISFFIARAVLWKRTDGWCLRPWRQGCLWWPEGWAAMRKS